MPPGGMRMRFTTNHDETAWDNPPVTLFGGAAGARAAFVAMALLPGRPLLYNGQEVESPQKLGLFVRDSIAWDQPARRRGPRLLSTGPATWRGPIRRSSREISGRSRPAPPRDVIAYGRGDAVVLVNARSHEVQFTVTGVDVDGALDLLSDRPQQGDTVTLPAYGAVVLRPCVKRRRGRSA